MNNQSKKRSLGFLGGLLFCLWWLIARLPAWWHYLWADFLYLIVRYVVHYRRDIVRKNLADFDYAEETDDPHKFLVFKGGDVLFAEINSPHEPIVIFRKATVMEAVSNLNRK